MKRSNSRSKWSAGIIALLILGTTANSVSSAESQTQSGQAGVVAQSEQGVSLRPAGEATVAADDLTTHAVTMTEHADTNASDSLALLISRVAKTMEFADWQGASAQRVRTLYDPEGRPNAVLWKVVQDSLAKGYLVASVDGRSLYEFSHGAVPALPSHVEKQPLATGYIYAGPMLHLVYVQGRDGLELYNVRSGEQIPTGELETRVPVLADPEAGVGERPSKSQVQAVEQFLPRSSSPADDALYAVGLFGQYKLNQATDQAPSTRKGVQPLTEFAKRDASQTAAFLLYDAVPNKFTISYAITNRVQVGSYTYFGVQDPFAGLTETIVYIDSRFPVFAVPLHTWSATNSKAKWKGSI